MFLDVLICFWVADIWVASQIVVRKVAMVKIDVGI
jgi:hypothetical protein